MLDTIRKRRSIRRYSDRRVDDSVVDQIIEMGSWAPSGLNNQPWKFVIVRDSQLRNELADCTKYGGIILNAPVCIAVFMDQAKSYDRVKDLQAIGACIQNMLLSVHHLGLGAVWLGEILNKKDQVAGILQVPSDLELMAVVALGYPAETKTGGSRKPIEELVVGRN